MEPLVYLVGAGPGDVGLLTLRAAEIIRDADVIIHDAIISQEILELRKASCELIDAGLRGFENPEWQLSLASRAADLAKQGLRVCRLKSGDPFIFGNGGETVDYLRELGCATEVVPGLTSGLAGPVRAGIPLSHSSVSASICLASGHWGSNPLDISAAASAGSLVLYMVRHRIGEIATKLMNAGTPANTPACFIERATHPKQRIVAAELRFIAQVAEREKVVDPAICVIGKTVGKVLLRNAVEERA